MMCQKLIFISHRTKDKSVGDMLLDFLSAAGIPRDAIKCSSIPGNDVKVKISSEVLDWIQHSVVNIAILSSDYYDSAYCLNEAGILWYLNEIPVIPIGLPEITHEKMIGFLNSDYKIRRLDSDDDIAYIYDTVQEALGISVAKHSVINTETKKLKERYNRFCDDRVTHTAMAEKADESFSYLAGENLLVLMDNNTYIDQYYLGEPAFSVYIEDGAEIILFDTGYSDAFLRNAEQMQVDLNVLTYIVLSHGSR